MKHKEILKLIKSYENLTSELVIVAEDENIDQKILERLSRLPHSEIMTAIALNPRTPSSVLKKWINLYNGVGGTDEEMRIHIMHNPSLSINF